MLKDFLKDTVSLIFGSLVFAAGLHIFILPCSLLMGGASGASIIINRLVGLPIGTGILAINIPLFIGALVICGRRYALKALYSTALFSVVIDLSELFITFTFTKSVFVSAVMGGVLSGIGSYILLRRTLVTGGSDLLAYLIHRKNPKRALGALIFIIDGAIILSGTLIYKSISRTVYSVLLTGIMSLILTAMLEKKYAKLFKRNNRP